MISNRVGCLVVVPTGHYQIPIGLVTKSDIIKAYYNGLASWDHECKDVMTTSDALVFCNPHMNRDEVAKVNESFVVLYPGAIRFQLRSDTVSSSISCRFRTPLGARKEPDSPCDCSRSQY